MDPSVGFVLQKSVADVPWNLFLCIMMQPTWSSTFTPMRDGTCSRLGRHHAMSLRARPKCLIVAWVRSDSGVCTFQGLERSGPRRRGESLVISTLTILLSHWIAMDTPSLSCIADAYRVGCDTSANRDVETTFLYRPDPFCALGCLITL